MSRKNQLDKQQEKELKEHRRETKGKEINLKTYTEILMMILLMKKGYTFVIRKPNKKTETTKQYIPLVHGKIDGREIFLANMKVLTKETKQYISNVLFNELLILKDELLLQDQIEIGFNTTKKVGRCSFPKIDYIIFHKTHQTITSKEFADVGEPFHTIISDLQEQGHKKIFLNFEIMNQQVQLSDFKDAIQFWSNFL